MSDVHEASNKTVILSSEEKQTVARLARAAVDSHPDSAKGTMRGHKIYARTQNPEGRSSLAVIARQALDSIRDGRSPVVRPNHLGWVWASVKEPGQTSGFGKRVWMAKWQYLPNRNAIYIAFVGRFASNNVEVTALPVEAHLNVECPEIDDLLDGAAYIR